MVISATVSLAVWLYFRPGASSRQRSGNRSALLPLVAVATVILVSMMNPSHIAETTDKTGKLPSDTLAEKQQFSPAPNHFAALPGTVDVLKTRNRAIALAAIVCLSAATGALGHGRPKTVKLACWIITLSGVAVAGVAYHYKSTGTELLLGRFETPNPRFYGPFRYNNYWTAWNILAASTSSALLLDALHRRRKLATIGAVLSIFILAIAVSASESRSALLVSGVFAIYLCAELSLTPLRRSGLVKNLDLNFKKIFLVGTAVTVLAGLVVTVTVTSTWHRWATPEYAEKQSGRFRDTIYQLSSVRQGELPDLRPAMARDTIKMALAKPGWGWGLGSFEYAFPQYAGPEFLEDRFQHETNNFGKLIRPKFAHNDWAQYWAELGTIGFVALLLAITRFVAPAIRRSTPISPPPLSRPLLTGCAIVATMSIWDFPLNNFAVLSLFAVTLGLATTVPTVATPGESER